MLEFVMLFGRGEHFTENRLVAYKQQVHLAETVSLLTWCISSSSSVKCYQTRTVEWNCCLQHNGNIETKFHQACTNTFSTAVHNCPLVSTKLCCLEARVN